MRISDLYKMLCSLYDTMPVDDIERFVVECEPDVRCVSIGNRISERESLLIRERGGELELGLFIAPEIIEILSAPNPINHPDALCCAIEGVSHFLYLCDRIEKDIKVTQLELELQAEVDKFILLNLIAARASGSSPPQLFDMQFEDHRFDPELPAEDRMRYIDASRYAAKYCHFLLIHYFNPLRMSDLVPQARDFFRRNLAEKIARLTP